MNTKTIIIIVVLLALGGVAYYGFSSSNDASTSSLTSTALVPVPGVAGPMGSSGGAAGAVAAPNGGDIQALLSQLNNLKIDNSFFDSPEYAILVDYTIAIPALPIGRPNPFAPLSGSVTAGASTSTTPKLAPVKNK